MLRQARPGVSQSRILPGTRAPGGRGRASTGGLIMADAETAPKDLVGFLDFYLVRKAPFQIPEGGKEILVKYGPWLAVIFLIISLPAVLFVLGVGTVLIPFAGVGYASGFGMAAIAMIIQLVLLVAALPGLFARKMSGWRLLFYSEVVGILSSLLNYAIIGAVVGGLIGLYIIFQVREKYHE
jgi:hypothetical protein